MLTSGNVSDYIFEDVENRSLKRRARYPKSIQAKTTFGLIRDELMVMLDSVITYKVFILVIYYRFLFLSTLPRCIITGWLARLTL
jgi:hypothetical protein